MMPVPGGSRASLGIRQPAAGARFCARAGVVLLWLMAAAPPVVAAPVAMAPVEVALDHVESGCHVTGGFTVPVPTATAWDVLSDYDHIPRFVASMVSSHAEQRDGKLLVHQTARAGFLFFHKTMRIELDVVERPYEQIVFQDQLLRDFDFYGGSWTLTPDSTGTRVEYALGAEPRGSIPRAMCGGALKRTAQELLSEVRQEMLRRALAAAPGGSAHTVQRGR